MLNVSLLEYDPSRRIRIIEYLRGNTGFFQLVRPGIAYSMEHLEIAYERAERAMENNLGVRDPGILFLMFLTGESQASSAIACGGLRDTDSRALAIYTEIQELEKFLGSFPEFSLSRSTGLPAVDPGKDSLIFPRMNSVDLKLYAKSSRAKRNIS
ncbi:MAG: hypothetical protein M1148_00640 [Candidatus Thermoplasmatota archaeon]|nr:hypothetical protein [Candidatus Thermoplasmatota archaeon]